MTIGGIEMRVGRAHVGFVGFSTVPLRGGRTFYVSLWQDRLAWFFCWHRVDARKSELLRAIRR